MRVVIDFIPHNEQRYPTLGDWQKKVRDGKEVMLIKISKMTDRRSEIAVAVHELVEALLCDVSGVTAEQVDAWDFAFKGEGEPGDDPRAPYHLEHLVATEVENEVVLLTGLSLIDHDKICLAAENSGG